jgi:hypothetical protein
VPHSGVLAKLLALPVFCAVVLTWLAGERLRRQPARGVFAVGCAAPCGGDWQFHGRARFAAFD